MRRGRSQRSLWPRGVALHAQWHGPRKATLWPSPVRTVAPGLSPAPPRGEQESPLPVVLIWRARYLMPPFGRIRRRRTSLSPNHVATYALGSPRPRALRFPAIYPLRLPDRTPNSADLTTPSTHSGPKMELISSLRLTGAGRPSPGPGPRRAPLRSRPAAPGTPAGRRRDAGRRRPAPRALRTPTSPGTSRTRRRRPGDRRRRRG
jgi:hypothetical protein